MPVKLNRFNKSKEIVNAYVDVSGREHRKLAAQYGVKIESGLYWFTQANYLAFMEAVNGKPLEIFTLEINMDVDGWWDNRFSFHAIDEADARDKVCGWASYQGMNSRYGEEVRTRPATEHEKQYYLHNEYLA